MKTCYSLYGYNLTLLIFYHRTIHKHLYYDHLCYKHHIAYT